MACPVPEAVPQPGAGSRVRPGLAVRCSAWSWSKWVSTAKQDLDRQVDALTTAGIPAKRIYLDKKSVATTDRPGLRVLLDYARPGADFTDASDDADRVLAVCDDVIVSHEVDGDLAVFDREAATFAAAVGSALADLQRSLPAARVLRVEAVPVAGELSVAAVS